MELSQPTFQFDDPSNQPVPNEIGVRHDGRSILRDGTVGPYVRRPVPYNQQIISNEIASAPLGIEGFAIYSGTEMQLYGTPIRTGVTDVESLRTSALPADKRERLLLATEYYNSDDYLGGVLDLKCDFSCLGFNLGYAMTKRHEAELLQMDEAALEVAMIKDLVQQAEIEEYLQLVCEEWKIPGIVADMFLRLYITDSFILYWRRDQNNRPGKTTLSGIWQVLSFDPKDCEWQNDQAQDRLIYTIPIHTQNKIREAYAVTYDPNVRLEKIAALREEGIPEEWDIAVFKNAGVIELKRDDGHNWIIFTKGPEQEGLSSPSMYRIFLQLESRRALRDGDFSTSYMMKHFIQHVTVGEATQSSGFAGNSRATWATPNEIETMHEIMRQGVRTSRLVTNHTVKINYVYPPKDMFDNAKYVKPEAAILHWSHMTEVMMTGKGTTNSSGYLGAKSLDAHVKFSRDRVSEAVRMFFRILREEKRVKEIPDIYYITSSFDENALKEPKQVLEELKWFVDTNAMSPETALRETGRDASRVLLEKRRAKISQRKLGLYDQVIVRASQVSGAQASSLSSGNSNPQDSQQDSGGRPPNPSTTQNEETRTQPSVLK